MKKLILSIVATATVSLSSLGQAPEGFKYQAVVRDAGNTILNNQPVGIQMTIQQGSIGGATVYQETFAPTTNAFGLVNLEIGTGTAVSGDFTTIDWANGPYFIETAVDVTGGANYVVMGTSQLMSVPYALHAKSAESVVNDSVNDADADPTNEIELQPYGLEGQILTMVNGVPQWTYPDCNLSIGDRRAGGLVFYIDSTGCHGLVACHVDASYQWGCEGTDINGADSSGVGTGLQNSLDIVADCNVPNIAANYALNLDIAGFDDWYLPSKDELNLMYQNIGPGNALGLGNIGNFNTNMEYWSSTEHPTDPMSAYYQYFWNGSSSYDWKSFVKGVRVIRAF